MVFNKRDFVSNLSQFLLPLIYDIGIQLELFPDEFLLVQWGHDWEFVNFLGGNFLINLVCDLPFKFFELSEFVPSISYVRNVHVDTHGHAFVAVPI